MFEQAFKNIDDILRKEAGCTTELDYTEQTSWLLFLKYLAGMEQDKAAEAALEGKKHSFILDKPYRWERWAAPKGKDGYLDHNAALTGDDLLDFVNQKLFPYLQGFKQRASGSDTIEFRPQLHRLTDLPLRCPASRVSPPPVSFCRVYFMNAGQQSQASPPDTVRFPIG